MIYSQKTPLLIMMLFSFHSLFGVELKISPSISQSIQKKQEAFAYMLKTERNYVLSNQSDAARIAKDNEILAKAYIEKYGLTDLEHSLFEVYVDEVLAKKMVKNIQKKVTIDDTVLESFYLDNIEKFTQKATASLEIFEFDNYDNAHDFYMYTKKHSTEESLKYAKSKKYKTYSYKNTLNKVNRTVTNFFKNSTDSDYFLPPLPIKKTMNVIYLKELQASDNITPFDQAKEEAKANLIHKKQKEAREELLKSYKEETK